MLQVMRRYHIQDRDDYKKYNKLCGMVTKVTSTLRKLDPQDPARIEMTDQLLDKYASYRAIRANTEMVPSKIWLNMTAL